MKIEQLEWRRSKVVELRARGLSQTEKRRRKKMMNRRICPNCKSNDVLEYPSMFQRETNRSFICNGCSFQWEVKGIEQHEEEEKM